MPWLANLIVYVLRVLGTIVVIVAVCWVTFFVYALVYSLMWQLVAGAYMGWFAAFLVAGALYLGVAFRRRPS